jgi:hypothetical protein
VNFPNGSRPFHRGAVIAIGHTSNGRPGYLMRVDDLRRTSVGVEVDGRQLDADLRPGTGRREHLVASSYTVLDPGRPPATVAAEPRPAGWVDAHVLASLATDPASAWWVLAQEYHHGRITAGYFAAARAHGELYAHPIVLSHSPDIRHAYHLAQTSQPYYERCWVCGPEGVYLVADARPDERPTAQLAAVAA